METLTKEIIEKVCEEYKQSLLRKIDIAKKVEKTKLEEIKAHKEFLLARDELHALKLN